MGTHINASFQKEVIVDGVATWEYIDSKYDERQHYNLFAWLADVRNYNGITPIAQMRGAPADMYIPYEDRCMDSSPSHWLTGREIIDAIERITPVTEKGVISNWTKFDGKEPNCYSRYTDRALPMDSPQVKHDSGYAANLWEAKCNFRKYNWNCNPGMGAAIACPGGGFRFKHPRVRPSVSKHLNKLSKYMRRAGKFDYVAEWTISPSERLQEFKYFIDEIHNLMTKHGSIRMVMGFN